MAVLAGCVGAGGLAEATEVSDEEGVPHNLWTVGETGCVRSPTWNSDRKVDSAVGEASATVEVDDAGKLER